jgi:hypothetical protein
VMAEGSPKVEPKDAASGRTPGDFRDIADELRGRVDLFGKTLAAIATTAVSAVGLAEIGDLFPTAGEDWWAVGACAALFVAGFFAVGIAVRLMRVSRPVFMRSDLDNNEELGKKEREAVRPVFEAAARRYGYTTLVGLQERERALRQASEWATDEEERARRAARADEVKTEIEDAMARGMVVTVRKRASAAVGDFKAAVFYALVIGGLIVFAVGTDRVSSARTDIADAKACAEAREAGAKAAELKASGKCAEAEKQQDPPPTPPTRAEARAELAVGLAERLKECVALVEVPGTEGQPLREADCEPVRQALAAAAAP